MGYSLRKAAEIMGVSEARLTTLVKEGQLSEEDSGLISENEITLWKRRVSDLDGRRYAGLRDATEDYERSGRFRFEALRAEALEHFAKEIEAHARAKWNEADKAARKALEAKRAEIEARYAEERKALGLDPLPAAGA